MHEFGFMFPAMHLHAVALELMLKTGILMHEPAGSSLRSVNVRTFPEKHNVRKLIEQWNALVPTKKII